jgi:transcriptional regulator with GAF, ATPase, and Fis domain
MTTLRKKRFSSFGGMIGRSAQMRELFELIDCVAEEGESTILVQGESGTGKERSRAPSMMAVRVKVVILFR